MKRIIVISLFLVLLPLHKAYGIMYGKCYNTRSESATHACLLLEEAKKLLADLQVFKKEAEKIPLLQTQIDTQKSTIKLLEVQLKKANDALLEFNKATELHEKANAKLNDENKKILVTAQKYEKENNDLKKERWVYLGIGIGAGVVITAGIVITVVVIKMSP